MTLIALIVLGIITATRLPVSLLPDIDIPEITIQINYKNTSARQLENAVVKPVRNQLLQLNHLKDIKSETRDGNAIIQLTFDYKTNINYAYIETNEKIDALMNSMPKEMELPKIIKASASDIPVFYLSIIPKESYFEKQNNLLEISEFTESVIKKRIEQLSEVAMVDISGLVFPEIAIIPDIELMQSLNLTYEQIENILTINNISLGNILVKDKQYQYNIKFSNQLKTIEDIENIYIKINDQSIIQLKDIAEVSIRTQKRKGIYLFNNHEAIVITVIKQANAQMAQLKEKLNELITEFNKNYKNLEFKVSQDQTQLLKFSLNNLKQSLLFGCLLAFLIMFFFMHDFKSPFLIGISIPASLIISIFFLYIFKISINIISLSGLILGVGMMIDNSIIVIDNINQYIEKKYSLSQACIEGTNEVIRPLISSVMTTCAVFIPLVFLSDISGALFYDQAVAIAVSLTTSLLVSIMILPVFYRLFYLKSKVVKSHSYVKKNSIINLENFYEKSIKIIFNHKIIFLLFFFLLFPLGIFLFQKIDIRSFPDIEKTDVILNIDWNENINVDENKHRLINLFEKIKTPVTYINSLVGQQQFLLNKEQENSFSEAKIYLKTQSAYNLSEVQNEIKNYIYTFHPNTKYSFEPPKNVFEQLFNYEQAQLTANIKSVNKNKPPDINDIDLLSYKLYIKSITEKINNIPLQQNLVISISPDKLLIYDVLYHSLFNKLKSSFNENNIGLLKSGNKFIPIIIGEKTELISDIINQAKVANNDNKLIPVKSLISISNTSDYKTILAGKEGEYIPINLSTNNKNIADIEKEVKSITNEFQLEASYTGSIIRNRKLLKELSIVLLISVLLLYFILAAQFESLTQPLIVLLEILFDFSGALILLILFGYSLNIMSAIGIIVMSGIIINDSILKIDTINKLRRQNVPLLQAIKIGGKRRLKPIIMTSLTTILALFPLLLYSGIGAELQIPLALAVIGGMTIGTIVSLYFIPLAYWLIYKRY